MNIFLLFLTFLLCNACSAVQLIVKNVEGYYWRDYKGTVPPDAVPGGIDKQGRTTYIGQALHEGPPNGKLIPGKIDATKRKMYYMWNELEHEVTKSVKILCSSDREHFTWESTDIAKIKTWDETKLVLGGYDTSYPLYIGRIHTEGEAAVGKVTIPTPYDAFCYSIEGKGKCISTEFEVLSYESPANEENSISGCAAKVFNINV